MKPQIRFVFLSLLVFSGLSSWAQESGNVSERQKTTLNLDWRYHRGDAPGSPFAPGYDDAAWEGVALPHSYALTSMNLDDTEETRDQPHFHRDISWYRRTIRPDVRPGQRVFLEFEGAHQRTELWVNGTYVGEHATSAYTPFHFDITDHINPGVDNVIALRLDNRRDEEIPPDGHIWDYVLFGGLYRDVYLHITDDMHITFPWEAREAGIFVTTPSVNHKTATVSIRTTLRNAGPADRHAQVVTRVLDADNIVVMKLTKNVTVPAGADRTVLQTGGIDEDLRLWSFDDPYLYRVNTQIVADGGIVDRSDTPLGLRWFEHRLGEGFLLNGEPTMLIGVNRHQQFPYIGDAVPDNLHRMDAVKMKRAGFNLVRLAHYPHDNSFFEACDELGMLIVEEPPSWIEFGPPIWMDRLEESFRITIRNHRNHPSVWGWGAGINHRGAVKRLHYAAKEEDPTRITMNNATVWTGQQHSGITDLYAVMDYRGAVRPEQELLFAMEHSGSVDTLETQKFISRYKGDPNLIGTALWSAHDNYSLKKRGTRYLNMSRWSAAPWDLFRLPKPNYWWFKSELTSEPMIRLGDSRAQHEGSVTVFTNCDAVELLHDGRVIGIFEPSITTETAHLESPSLAIPFAWETREITVRGLIDGEVVAEHSQRKQGAAHHLEVHFDTDGFTGHADGSSIVMAYASVHDATGQVIDAETPLVTFAVEGPAEIVGDASIGANPVFWEHGYAPVLVRVGATPGIITLTATSGDLGATRDTLTTTAWTDDWLAQNSRPVHEPVRLRVDLGNKKQHIEDEWTPWSVGVWDRPFREVEREIMISTPGASPDTAVTFAAGNGANIRATISGNGTPLQWSRTWGVPGDLSFMIEDSVATNEEGVIILRFEDLPAGRYELKTWHHVVTTRHRSGAPPVEISLSDSRQDTAIMHRAFKPSFGGIIKVSDAGVGGPGDGGSNRGASTHALTPLTTDGETVIELRFRATAPGPVNLSGFDLRQIVDP